MMYSSRIVLTTTKVLPRTTTTTINNIAAAALTKRSFHVSAGALHLCRTKLILPSNETNHMKRIVGVVAIGVVAGVGYVVASHHHGNLERSIGHIISFENKITASEKRNTKEGEEEDHLDRNKKIGSLYTKMKDDGPTTANNNTLEVTSQISTLDILKEGGSERIVVSRYELI